jgi:hypothetical protein
MKRFSISLILSCSYSRQIDPTMNPDSLGAYWKYFVAMYDNAAAFEKYLKKQGTDEAARKAGVKLKRKHSIVPHVRAFRLHTAGMT